MFKYECANCGASLKITGRLSSTDILLVEPCEKCIQESFDNGEDFGYENGKADYQSWEQV